MADADQVSAAPDRIGKHGFIESGLGVGIGIAAHRGLVQGVGGFVPDRLYSAQIGDNGVEIAR